MRDTRKNITNFLKGINRSVVAVLMLTFTFTACVQPEWSPYTSNAEIRSVLVSAQPTIISGTTVGDPMLTWELKVTDGNDFCTAVKKFCESRSLQLDCVSRIIFVDIVF